MKRLLGSIVVLSLASCSAIALASAANQPELRGTTTDVAPQAESENILALQVALDRAGFSPGVLDSHEGRSTTLALAAFQTSRRLHATGKLDDETSAALNLDTASATTLITADETSVGTVGGPLPKEPEDAAGLTAMAYTSFAEALAEKYHTTPKALAALNPDVEIEPGAALRVPNVETNDGTFAQLQPASIGTGAGTGIDADAAWQATLSTLNVSPLQPEAAIVVVNKARGDIRAYDAQGRLIAAFPATVGSTDNPSPVGDLKIRGISRNPPFKYDSKVLGEKKESKKFMLAPGPNNLVGVVWIDLSKPHNGIHGTPNPELIGRAASHGCVRMTNWDAARLAQMVKPGTAVTFTGKKPKARTAPL